MSKSLIALLAVAVFAIVGAACSGGETNADVRPFEEVQGSDLTFENDPTFPGRGIFRVTTTEPMICAIVWGETEDLGNFNNSLEMNGTGLAQHNVFLPGAEPGGTYFYRVQGSTADGTLYQSDLMTFTLPEVEEDDGASAASTDLGPNLALEATVVEVSSEFGDSWAANNALDGDLNTEWSSRGDGDGSYITIDLGSAQNIAALAFLTRTMADGSATTTTYTITVDGGETFGPYPAGNPADSQPAEVDFTGQVLRFDVASSSGGNTGAIEIQVFGQ